jgi:CheY-like chemotaxis protein
MPYACGQGQPEARPPVLDGIEATRLLAGPGVADAVKVLVVTTFNIDEYVYEALRAGASGFAQASCTRTSEPPGPGRLPRARSGYMTAWAGSTSDAGSFCRWG